MSCDRNSFGEYFSREFSVKSNITFKECNIEVYNREKAFKQFSHRCQGFEMTPLTLFKLDTFWKKIVTFQVIYGQIVIIGNRYKIAKSCPI